MCTYRTVCESKRILLHWHQSHKKRIIAMVLNHVLIFLFSCIAFEMSAYRSLMEISSDQFGQSPRERSVF